VRHAVVLRFDGDQPVHGFANHIDHGVPLLIFPRELGTFAGDRTSPNSALK
jgi:hypothetical protein